MRPAEVAAGRGLPYSTPCPWCPLPDHLAHSTMSAMSSGSTAHCATKTAKKSSTTPTMDAIHCSGPPERGLASGWMMRGRDGRVTVLQSSISADDMTIKPMKEFNTTAIPTIIAARGGRR